MGLGKFFGKSKYKIVFSIGDEGAILSCVEGNKLVKRLFVSGPHAPEVKEFVSEFPDAPLHLLVDVVDQAYTHHTLPPVSMINRSKMIKRKLTRDFESKDVKAAIPMGRTSNNKELSYLFVSMHNAPPMSEWLDVVLSLPNDIAGIFLLPVEAVTYLRDLQKSVFTKDNPKKPSGWQIIVSHNKVGGFRQIVFKNGMVMFTRISQPIGSRTPDVVAGNIEQEALNTIEYIRRLGFEEGDGVDIYIITSSEVKDVLEVNTLAASTLTVLTPFEVAERFKLVNTAQESDRFGDVVVAAHFVAQRPVLRLQTPRIKKLVLLQTSRILLRVGAVLLAVGLMAFSGFNVKEALTLEGQVSASEKEKVAVQTKLQKAQQLLDQFGEGKEAIKEIALLDSELSGSSFVAFEFLSKFEEIKGFDMHMSELAIDVEKRPNNPDKVTASMSIEFFNTKGATFAELLDNIDLFTNDVKRVFEGYQVDFSGLPDATRLNFEGDVSLRLNIVGPQIATKSTNSRRRR